ncbi:MAG: cytochrome c3 family protein [Candidatus Neomarinimicrobiota bacterium]
MTDHKVECQNCHQIILHQSVSRSVGIMPECESCHAKSHAAQLDLFSGMGGKDVPPHPNPMFDEGLNCQGCHIFHQLESGFAEMGETALARAESCEKCHGGGYGRILQQWKNLMARKVDLLRIAFTTVEADIGSSVVSEKARQNALVMVNDARFNFELVEQGNFVHNVAYSDELLSAAHDRLAEALNLIGSTSAIPEIAVYSELVPSECKNCHYGQEEIDVATFGITFSHSIHIERNRLLCSKCHSNMRQHGELVIRRDECLSCHHSQDEVSCEKCHNIQSKIYSGSVDFATEAMPDFMYEAGVECRGCHEGTQGQVERVGADKCADCHDSEYKELLIEWQEATARSMEEVSGKMSGLPFDRLSVDDRKKIERVRQALQKIEKDRSGGAHNIQLIEETLLAYKEFLGHLPE